MRTFTTRLLLVSLLLVVVFAVPALAKIDKSLYQLLDNYALELEKSRHYATSGEDNKGVSAAHAQSLTALEERVSTVQSSDDIRLFFSTLNVFLQTKRGIPYTMAVMKSATLLEEKSRFIFAQGGDPESLNTLQSEISRLKAMDTEPTDAAPKAVAQFSMESQKSTSKGDLPSGLLGAKVTASGTSFSVYSPRATSCTLLLFKNAGDKTGKKFPMKKSANGIWKASIKQNLTGYWYKYAVDGPKGPGERFNVNIPQSDPYSLCNDTAHGKSRVCSEEYTWKSTFRRPKMKDLIIYEMHVKDYTAHSSSGVTGAKKGNYLGLLEGKSSDIVLGNLIELGVNAVELLPVQEFDNKAAPSGVNHWGYMTTHFFAPESSFASGSQGQQVKELKKLIDGLHAAGIAVIMDVVYNHTAEGNEQGPSICYKGLDNKSYYRLYKNPDQYWNGTGCGNEFRSDHPVTRKLIIDSLKFWAKDYKIDGFRFDLCTILDKKTMSDIAEQVPAGVYLIAEPWAADWSRNQWTKNDFCNGRWSKWNDGYKSAIRKFIRGNGNRDDVMTALAGSCFWWAGKPEESINFIECHDNATLMDYLGNWEQGARFGMTVLLTSQGVPMLHEGMEFLKTKFGNDNSYDQDNKTNWIDWGLKKKNRSTFDYVAGLIKIRKTFPQFRHAAPLNSSSITWLKPSNCKAVGFILSGTKDIIVLLNSDPSNWVTFDLPANHDWTILCNGNQAGIDGSLGTASGNYRVPPTTGIILRK